MAIPQQKFRELVFQMLYASSFLADDFDPSFFMHQLKTTKKNVDEAHMLVKKIMDQIELLDQKIAEVSTSYEFDRIQSVEKNILRLCLFELLNEKDLSPNVIISEGIRLTKKFSTTPSLKFVNALLDRLSKNHLSVL